VKPSEDREDFRSAARSWLAAHAEPARWETEMAIGLIKEVNSAAEVEQVRAWNKAKFDGGWAGITWPQRFGGRGLTLAEHMTWKHEVARYRTSEDGCIVGPSLVGPIILEYGTAEQQERFIAPILRGDHIWCQLFSEPEAGSDLAGLRSFARREGDEWVLSGEKIWSSAAQFADWGLLLARTDREAPKHRGITCFALNMGAPGIRIRPIEQMNGYRTFNQVWFDQVRIPDANRIGDAGGGWRVATGTLGTERLDLGLRQGVNVARLVRLAETAATDGVRAVDEPSFRDRLVDVYVRAEALSALGRQAVEDALAGRPVGPQGPIAKLVGAGLMNEAANLALDMQGPHGVLIGDDAAESGVWQHGFLSSPARRLGGGADEIQRNVIAERFLGLPRSLPPPPSGWAGIARAPSRGRPEQP
jgi:alkylation response protein AidB-like acyl-CoA dehydrogenase